jgi:hypothetical protein
MPLRLKSPRRCNRKRSEVFSALHGAPVGAVAQATAKIQRAALPRRIPPFANPSAVGWPIYWFVARRPPLAGRRLRRISAERSGWRRTPARSRRPKGPLPPPPGLTPHPFVMRRQPGSVETTILNLSGINRRRAAKLVPAGINPAAHLGRSHWDYSPRCL